MFLINSIYKLDNINLIINLKSLFNLYFKIFKDIIIYFKIIIFSYINYLFT
jgi:hypothetical protein